jgi:hypothetical protein
MGFCDDEGVSRFDSEVGAGYTSMLSSMLRSLSSEREASKTEGSEGASATGN